MADIYEFMTGWNAEDHGFRPSVWAKRDIAELKGTVRSNRGIARFRPFDMLREPNATLPLFENEDQRIGVESVVGAQPGFTRNLDFDLLLLQFAGESTVETEFGTYTLRSGELLHVPGGTAHRSIGSADCLRLFVKLAEPVATIYGADKHRSETEFTMRRRNGPSWAASAPAVPAGRVAERMVSWYDGPDDFAVAERDYAGLIGASSTKRSTAESAVTKLRIFDVFWEITGQGRGPGPKIVGSPCFMMDVYNTRGAQHAYHRALRTDEFGLHFRGRSFNMSELEERTEILPGDVFTVPRGIAHRVEAADDDFLRVVFYATKPWRVCVPPADHAFESRFDVETKVIARPDWVAAAE